jgi:HPt (histidine-containing phosphotransfer) domain-containing protein
VALIDPVQFSKLRELAAGDDAFVAGVLDAFLPQLRAVPTALRRAVTDGDAPAAAELAHSLKGSAGNVGAEDVAALCLEIERLARGGELAVLTALVDELESAAAATGRVFEAERARLG